MTTTLTTSRLQDDTRFDDARRHFAMVAMLEHTARLIRDDATATYGTNGTWIAGGFCDHWPESIKQPLRDLNLAINAATDAGFAARPPRVRGVTMQRLYRLSTYR